MTSVPSEKTQYPPQEGFPLLPQTGGYPQGPQAPAPGIYAPPAGYPPAQHGYPPPQPGYPQAQPGYPPAQGGYPPPQGAYPPPQAGYPPGPPIMTQPMAQGGPPNLNWMVVPQAIPNCPRGLEYLSALGQLLVKQKVELLEVVTGFEGQNKYSIKNNIGQLVYFAEEESDCCTRNCCGPRRPFDMRVSDNFGNEVIHFNRPLACQSCCFPCCLQSMEVSAPPGTIVGTVEQQWSLCIPSFAIKNPSGDVVLRIEGPCCTCSCCGDVDFKVLSPDGDREVGKISKQWSGFAKEAFTDADTFGITFPEDLDVRMKAVMLGACFLIDMMYFEQSQKRPEHR